jgi:hypothetical protein
MTETSVTTMRRRPAAAAELAGASSAVLRRQRRAPRAAGVAPACGIKFGLLRSQLTVPNDFDEPLPPDVLGTFVSAITSENQHLPDDDSPRGREAW